MLKSRLMMLALSLGLGYAFAQKQEGAGAATTDKVTVVKGRVTIQQGWVRLANVGKNTAAYMTLTATDGGDELIGASCNFADRVELHDHIIKDNIARMQAVDEITFSSVAPAELKPGGKHVMFFGLKENLAVGQQVLLTLKFKKAGAVDVLLPVQPLE